MHRTNTSTIRSVFSELQMWLPNVMLRYVSTFSMHIQTAYQSSCVARGRRGGGPPRVSPFCNTSQTENKTTICLISLEMLSTLKLTKK